MPNLVELVLRDHAQERALMRRVRWAARSEVRHDAALGALVRLLVSDEAAKSLVLFPSVRRFVPGSQRVTDALLEGRRPMETLLTELQHRTGCAADFLKGLDALAAHRVAHARDVEVRLLPPFRHSTSSVVLHRLGEHYLAVRGAADTLAIAGTPVDFAATSVRDLIDAVHRCAHEALARAAWSWGGTLRKTTLAVPAAARRRARGPAGTVVHPREPEPQPSLP